MEIEADAERVHELDRETHAAVRAALKELGL